MSPIKLPHNIVERYGCHYFEQVYLTIIETISFRRKVVLFDVLTINFRYIVIQSISVQYFI